jgi:hypothetical protein
VLVTVANKVRPWLLVELLALHQLFYVLRYFQIVLVHVFVKIIFAQHAHNSNQLVEIVASLEKGLNFENHTSHGAAERPDVERVVLESIIDQKLRAFVVSASNTHIVLFVWEVEVSEAPVDESQLLRVIVDDNIQRFYISVHNAVLVRKLERFKNFIDVNTHIVITQIW